MKKRLFILTVMTFFCFVSSANCNENFKEVSSDCSCKSGEQSQKEDNKNCNKSEDIQKKDYKNNKISECSCEDELEDDEYCTYNQCFFDKQYRNMKRILCLTRRQENCIDNYYRNFKSDMEKLCDDYKNEKNKLLKIIECNEGCYKEQKRNLKEIKSEAKEKIKDFREDIKDQLCKSQRNDFRKFQREEKRKVKKLMKYCKVYKFPCVSCCDK